MATAVTRKPKPDSTLQRFRRWLWTKFVEWDSFDEICSEIGFGEIRIVIHDGEMRDLHVELHVRKDK